MTHHVHNVMQQNDSSWRGITIHTDEAWCWWFHMAHCDELAWFTTVNHHDHESSWCIVMNHHDDVSWWFPLMSHDRIRWFIRIISTNYVYTHAHAHVPMIEHVKLHFERVDIFKHAHLHIQCILSKCSAIWLEHIKVFLPVHHCCCWWWCCVNLSEPELFSK